MGCSGEEGGLRAHLTGPSPACLHCPSVVEWTTTSTRVTMAILGPPTASARWPCSGLGLHPAGLRTLQLAVSVPFFVVFLISWSVQCGAFSLGRSGRESQVGAPHPAFRLAMAPKDAETLEESDVVRPHWRDVEAQSFGVGISASLRFPPAQPAGPGLEGSILYSH